MHNAKKYRKTRDYAIDTDIYTHTHTQSKKSIRIHAHFDFTFFVLFHFFSTNKRRHTVNAFNFYYCCIVTNTQQIVFVLLFRIFRSARVIKFVTRVWRSTQLHVNATQRKHNTAQRGTAPLNSTQFVGNAKLDATRLTAIVPLAGIASWLACWLTYWLAAWLLD